MEKQCAGCGKVFDDESGKENVSPRPYGCCKECNAHTFRSDVKPEPKASKPKASSAT